MSDNVAGLESLSQQFRPDEHQLNSTDSSFKFIHDECVSCVRSSHDRYGDSPSQMLHDAIQKIDQLEQATDDTTLKKHVSNVKIALQELSMEGKVTLDKMRAAVELGLQDNASQAYTGGVQVQLSSMNAQQSSNDSHNQHNETKATLKRKKPQKKKAPSLVGSFLKWLGK